MRPDIAGGYVYVHSSQTVNGVRVYRLYDAVINRTVTAVEQTELPCNSIGKHDIGCPHYRKGEKAIGYQYKSEKK